MKLYRYFLIFPALLLGLLIANSQNSPPQLPGHGVQGNFDPGLLQYVLVENITVSSGDAHCYNASTGITIQNINVEPNGSITLIAGESIIMLPGVLVQNNGYLHAYISEIYCIDPTPLTENDSETLLGAGVIKRDENLDLISVYPNPSSGIYNLKFSFDELSDSYTIEIYNLLGDKMLSKKIPGSLQYVLNITELPPGIYLLRIANNREHIFKKIIKH